MAKNYYDILNISKSATNEEIKKSYRRLAHKFHPDKEGGDATKFKEINEAYQVLSDPQKRRQYDQFGTTFEQAQAQGGYSGFNGFRDYSGSSETFSNGFNFSEDFGLGDIFGNIFGGRSKTANKKRRGQDLTIEVEISLEEAYRGHEREFSIYKPIICPKCKGSAGEEDSRLEKCSTCGGEGTVAKTKRAGFISFSQTEICSHCRGAGQRPTRPCLRCGGDGRVNEQVNLKVKIPAGIGHEQIIKLTGQGEAAPLGGIAGDLYLTVYIKKHPFFTRRGDDLYCEQIIHFSQAALGDKIDLITLSGSIRVNIPAGIDSGEVIRLKGQGMTRFGGRGQGDLYIRVRVKTPKKLSRQAKKIIEQLKHDFGH